MLVHHSPFSWLQVVSHFPDQHISACLYMTAWTRQFACSTDNKRACACQNRWRCVTVSTQCCLLLAWPSTSRHVSFHNQEKGKTGRRNHPAFLAASFCCCLFGINLIPMSLAMLSSSCFLLFLVCFPPISLSICLALPLPLPCLCFGIKALILKEWLISVCLLFQDNVSFFFQTEIMRSVFACCDQISAEKWDYYFWISACTLYKVIDGSG